MTQNERVIGILIGIKGKKKIFIFAQFWLSIEDVLQKEKKNLHFISE